MKNAGPIRSRSCRFAGPCELGAGAAPRSVALRGPSTVRWPPPDPGVGSSHSRRPALLHRSSTTRLRLLGIPLRLVAAAGTNSQGRCGSPAAGPPAAALRLSRLLGVDQGDSRRVPYHAHHVVAGQATPDDLTSPGHLNTFLYADLT